MLRLEIKKYKYIGYIKYYPINSIIIKIVIENDMDETLSKKFCNYVSLASCWPISIVMLFFCSHYNLAKILPNALRLCTSLNFHRKIFKQFYDGEYVTFSILIDTIYKLVFIECV